jgi:hypothetical protein
VFVGIAFTVVVHDDAVPARRSGGDGADFKALLFPGGTIGEGRFNAGSRFSYLYQARAYEYGRFNAVAGIVDGTIETPALDAGTFLESPPHLDIVLKTAG